MKWIFFFLVYAFVGWCSEVAFAAVKNGRFVNRGFLAGPVCPIYGFGVVIVVSCLDGLRDQPLLLFLGAAVLTSVLEFVTGWVLERFFHKKWWDYSRVPLNIKGYVCLPFSLAWGLGCMGILYVVHPLVGRLWSLFPLWLTLFVLLPFAGLLADAYYTVSGILKIHRSMGRLEEWEALLTKTSDKIGGNIAEAVFTAKENEEKTKEKAVLLRERAEKARARTDEAWENYQKLLKKREVRLSDRLAKAFPSLQKQHFFSGAAERLKHFKAYCLKQKKN